MAGDILTEAADPPAKVCGLLRDLRKEPRTLTTGPGYESLKRNQLNLVSLDEKIVRRRASQTSKGRKTKLKEESP